MVVRFLDLKAQYLSIKDEIDGCMHDVILDSAFIKGKYVAEFEKAFGKYCGVDHCVGVGTGTDALFVVLKALGIGQGDEVITVPSTFIATTEAITSTGAGVRFVDCEPLYHAIDVSKMKRAVNSHTKAIIPVHLYGQTADMAPLLDLADAHDLHVIEDAAQVHGAEYEGRRAGSFGIAGAFSFYPGKNLGAYGDGGAIVTNDADLARKCRMLSNHGRVKKYTHEFEGINSRLDGLQAAILGVKLKYLDEWNLKRQKIANTYSERLNIEGIQLPAVRAGSTHVYHIYAIQVDARDELKTFLNERGVQTGIHYPIPLHLQEAYQTMSHQKGDFPVSEQLSEHMLSLPIYPELTIEMQDHVIQSILEFFKA